jgi:hypothetical protein
MGWLAIANNGLAHTGRFAQSRGVPKKSEKERLHSLLRKIDGWACCVLFAPLLNLFINIAWEMAQVSCMPDMTRDVTDLHALSTMYLKPDDFAHRVMACSVKLFNIYTCRTWTVSSCRFSGE